MDMYAILAILSLIVTLYVPLCYGHADDSKINQVENVTFLEGETVVFQCSVYNPYRHMVRWLIDVRYIVTKNERLLATDERFRLIFRTENDTDDSDLTIEQVTHEDEGSYICELQGSSPITVKTINLNIQDELSSRNSTVQEGERAMLVCNMTGIPQPEVTWYKLSNDTKEVVQTSGQAFMMTEITPFDHGTYQCVGYNGVGSAAYRFIKLNVYFRPRVLVPVNHISRQSGDDVVLECEITANPDGVARWRKGDTVIDLFRFDKYKAELYDSSLETKRILSLKVMDLEPEDDGQYVCFAMNQMGEDKESVLLGDGSAHGVTEIPTHSISLTTRRAIYDETVTDVSNTKTGEDLSEETVVAAQLEYYRDQMLTNKLQRNMIEKEQAFYDYLRSFLELQ